MEMRRRMPRPTLPPVTTDEVTAAAVVEL